MTSSNSSLEFFQLPKKYQRKAITTEEADAINVKKLFIDKHFRIDIVISFFICRKVASDLN